MLNNMLLIIYFNICIFVRLSLYNEGNLLTYWCFQRIQDLRPSVSTSAHLEKFATKMISFLERNEKGASECVGFNVASDTI